MTAIVIGTVIAFVIGFVSGVVLLALCIVGEKEDMRNGEGYIDTTAGSAVRAVTMYEQEVAQRNHRLIADFRQAVEGQGFEIVGRITLRHKQSGRVFK